MTELTAELIVDMPMPGELALSPDGTLAAYTLMPAGKAEPHARAGIWLAHVDGSAPPRPFVPDASENRRPRWSPDGRHIAFLSDRAERGVAQLYVIAADGGEARALTPAANKRPVLAFAWSPDGARIAYTSADEPDAEEKRRSEERDDPDVFGERWQHARLRVVSARGGEPYTLVNAPRHVAELAWSPDGAQIAYLTWQAPPLEFCGRDVRIEAVGAEGGAARLVCRLPRNGEALAWSGDGQRLLWRAPLSVHFAQSSSAIWAVAASGGEPYRLAFGEESCAMELIQPTASSHALVVAAAGLDTQLHWLEAQGGMLSHFYSVSDDVPVRDIASVAVRLLPDGSAVFAAVRAGGVSAWEVWSARLEANSLAPLIWKPISKHQCALDGIRFGEQEPFHWQAADGLALDGLFVRPVTDAPPPWRTILLAHGGPYGRWSQTFTCGWGRWAQWLATAGYAVLLPNPRGGMGHGERFAAAARGDVGGADWRDLMSALDAAVARGWADPERLGIGGWSQGGFMTAWGVTQTRRFKAGVMGAGVGDWGMMTLTGDVPDFEIDLGGTAPWDGLAGQTHRALSPVTFARQAATPLLILHGQDDARVPVSQAVGFHRALRAVQVPCELVVYPREPHAIGERAHQLDLLRRVRAWYDRYLGDDR